MRLLGKALTFDDVLLVPAYSQVLPKDASLSTSFSRNIQLNLPLVSAAMDTVTEARLAIAIAQEGGIGIVHKNMSADAQAREVLRVKKYESGVISDPITVTPDTSTLEVLRIMRDQKVGALPVIDDGKLVGIVTEHDLLDVSTFDQVQVEATDGSLEFDVIDENVYVLTGLADDIADGPRRIDRNQLDLAVELFTDAADYGDDNNVSEALGSSTPLGWFVDYAINPDPKRLAPSGPFDNESEAWRALEHDFEARLDKKS